MPHVSIWVKPVGDVFCHGVLMLSRLDSLVSGAILLGPPHVDNSTNLEIAYFYTS